MLSLLENIEQKRNLEEEIVTLRIIKLIEQREASDYSIQFF